MKLGSKLSQNEAEDFCTVQSFIVVIVDFHCELKTSNVSPSVLLKYVLKLAVISL